MAGPSYPGSRRGSGRLRIEPCAKARAVENVLVSALDAYAHDGGHQLLDDALHARHVRVRPVHRHLNRRHCRRAAAQPGPHKRTAAGRRRMLQGWRRR